MAEIDYRSILEEAWQQHLAPRDYNAPTVISLFAGCGGSSLGYSMAGYKELLAVEMNDNAITTFKANFPGIPVYHGDIAKLSVQECLDLAQVQPRELSLLDGSPPCQGFSMAGKRKLDDPRNSLFKEYVRLIRGLKPKVFVMENVSGLVKGKMKLVFAEIMKELKASGYNVRCKLLNAKYFQVPQSRQRLIFTGVHRDFFCYPSFPSITSIAFITPRLAFYNCDDKNGVVFEEWQKEAARLMKPGNYNVINARNAFLVTRGKTGGAMNFKLLSFDRVSCTLTKEWIGCSGIGHPSKDRFLSLGEIKRLSSFPDCFILPKDFKKSLALLGNSVPPLFMRAIANHIKKEILRK